MESENPRDSGLKANRLKQEIARLSRLQTDALQHAVFVGMTYEQRQEYDLRRTEITRLMKQLGTLTNLLS